MRTRISSLARPAQRRGRERVLVRRVIAVAAVASIGALAVPSLASASVSVSASASASAHGRYCASNTSTTNRAGYVVTLTGFRAGGTMNCASVRYVVSQWLRRSLARQSGYPALGRPFFDGFVTWHCHRIGGYHRWQCAEYTSNTWFRFSGSVY